MSTKKKGKNNKNNNNDSNSESWTTTSAITTTAAITISTATTTKGTTKSKSLKRKKITETKVKISFHYLNNCSTETMFYLACALSSVSRVGNAHAVPSKVFFELVPVAVLHDRFQSYALLAIERWHRYSHQLVWKTSIRRAQPWVSHWKTTTTFNQGN